MWCSPKDIIIAGWFRIARLLFCVIRFGIPMVCAFRFIQVQSLTLSKNVLSAFLKLDTPLVLILFDNNLANDMSLDDIELAIVRSKFCHELDLSC